MICIKGKKLYFGFVDLEGVINFEGEWGVPL